MQNNYDKQIVMRNIKDLKPYKKNAKKHPKEQVERIANSIKEFGFTQPVLVDKNNCVVAGHGRILGAKAAGLKEVPTLCLDDLTEEQIKAYRLADNKLNESDWDFSLLDEELEELNSIPELDMSLFGFDEAMTDETEEENEKKNKKIEFEIQEKYEVHIICKDEKQMEEVYNKTKGMGIDCKLVSTL